MIKIDGKKNATELIHELIHEQKPKKSLAVVLVGNDKASLSFIKQKERVAKDLGIGFKLCQLDESINQEELEEKVKRLSDDKEVGGIVVQLPLPNKFNRDEVFKSINPKKDVDKDLAVNVVKDVLNSLPNEQRFKKFKDLKNLNIAVVGQGFLIGQPVARWFEKESVDYRVADINTKNLKSFLADADLIITGVGKKNLINPGWLKEGAGVIDFGYPADLIQPPASSLQHLMFYTPTPGGTGPILVAELFRSFYKINL